MSPSAPEAQNLREELDASIGTILDVLQAVSCGDLTKKLTFDFPDDHPAGALATSVNSMIEALIVAREESADTLHELSRRIELIERQREAIETLSVPVIEVWSGVLCIPIVGVLDSRRASDITQALMNAVVRQKARYAIIDLTGIEIMDTTSADHFLRMARSVTLLGARCALSGINPNIARTIIHMGLDLGGLKSFRTMREALQFCVKRDRAEGRV
jgi:rsbT co-antagonist protein RsbR